MTDPDRYRLLFGPYRSPRVAIGRVLTCEARDLLPGVVFRLTAVVRPPARGVLLALEVLNVARHLTPEEVHAFRKKVVDQCTLDISRATIPFFGFHNNQVVLFGSGTLLQIADRHFIVSAAHVLDYPAVHGIPTLLSPGTDGGKFIPLDRTRVYTTPIPKGRREGPAMREGDDDDVGVCELPAEIAEQLRPARRFVRLDEVSRRKGFQQGFYMVIGYPVSFSRPLDQDRKQLFTEPLRCVTELHRDDLPPHNAERHVFLDYPREGIDSEGEPRASPPAPGISGGGIWRLADPGKPASLWRPEDVQLFAVEHSWHSKQRYVRGTHVAVALSLMYHYNPSLRDALEIKYPHL